MNQPQPASRKRSRSGSPPHAGALGDDDDGPTALLLHLGPQLWSRLYHFGGLMDRLIDEVSSAAIFSEELRIHKDEGLRADWGVPEDACLIMRLPPDDPFRPGTPFESPIPFPRPRGVQAVLDCVAGLLGGTDPFPGWLEVGTRVLEYRRHSVPGLLNVLEMKVARP